MILCKFVDIIQAKPITIMKKFPSCMLLDYIVFGIATMMILLLSKPFNLENALLRDSLLQQSAAPKPDASHSQDIYIPPAMAPVLSFSLRHLLREYDF